MPKNLVHGKVSSRVLDVEECLVLLRWELVGRLAVNVPGDAPTVVPVNFVTSNGAVFFRTGDGEKLDLITNGKVSLQVDGFDRFRRVGWSVLVKGVAAEVDPATVDDLELDPWDPTDKPHVIRITPTAITGRRLELRASPLDTRAYL